MTAHTGLGHKGGITVLMSRSFLMFDTNAPSSSRSHSVLPLRQNAPVSRTTGDCVSGICALFRWKLRARLVSRAHALRCTIIYKINAQSLQPIICPSAPVRGLVEPCTRGRTGRVEGGRGPFVPIRLVVSGINLGLQNLSWYNITFSAGSTLLTRGNGRMRTEGGREKSLNNS